MNTDKLIKDLGLTNVKIREDEIMASCPFAEVMHEKRTDRHPSFAINMDKGVFNCFTCGAKGILEDLVARQLLINLSQAIDYLEEIGFSKFDLVSESFLAERTTTPIWIPEMVLEEFIRLNEPSYEMYESTIEGQDCIVYVVRNIIGQLVGGSARSKTGRFHKNLWQMQKSLFLMGEHEVDGNLPLVLVEGPGDMLAIKKSGYSNAVSMMGSKISRVQASKIIRLTDEVIVWLDRDKAGYDGTRQIYEMLGNSLSLRFVDTSKMEDCENDAKDVLKNRGADAVVRLVKESKTYLEMLVGI